MIAYGLPILMTMVLWLDLDRIPARFLDSLDQRTFGRTMVGASARFSARSLARYDDIGRDDARLRLYRFCLWHRVVGRPTPGVLHGLRHRPEQISVLCGRRGAVALPTSRQRESLS